MDERQRFNSMRPTVESTKSYGAANLSNVSNRQNQFEWGKTISTKSPGKNNNNSTINASASRRLTPEAIRTDISKIDPRTYADVHSRGLASRIVKYHEASSGSLKRSMSLNNLHCKPGKFPIVHLKKSDAQYKAARQPVSMTRIPAPEKSHFYGNTLSSLLRSNSVVGLHSNDVELSRENRPILHPHTESESSPTRSVLDALKEISRKRINSDEADSNDVSKKYRSYDMQGSARPDCHSPYFGQFRTHQPFYATPTAMPPALKRQREPARITSTVGELQAASHTERPEVIGERSPPSQGHQSSPEQASKKRLCTYNNDITSSLSSSKLQTNKRKQLDEQSGSPKANGLQVKRPSEDISYKQKEKLSRYQPAELEHIKQLARSVSGAKSKPLTAAPVTPLPSTPCIMIPTQRSPRAQDVQRYNSVPVIASKKPEDISRCSSDLLGTGTINGRNENPSKPRITLFNKPINDAPIVSELLDRPPSPVDDACAGIKFIKPRKDTSGFSTRSKALLERTKKAKLALLLAGLRGEIYRGEPDEATAGDGGVASDEVDTQKKNNNIYAEKPQTEAPAQASKASTSQKQEIPKSPPSSKGPLISFDGPKTINPPIQISDTTTAAKPVEKSNFSYGLKPAMTTTPTSENSTLTPATASSIAPKTTTVTSISTTPTNLVTPFAAQSGNGGFSFGLKPPANDSLSSAANVAVEKSTASSGFAGFNFPAATSASSTFTLPSATVTPSTQPLESGLAMKPASNTPMPQFGIASTATTSAPSASTAAPMPTAKPMFSFGSNATAAAVPASNSSVSSAFLIKPNTSAADAAAQSFTLAAAAKPLGLLQFGQNSTNSISAPTATATTSLNPAPASGIFSFGAVPTTTVGIAAPPANSAVITAVSGEVTKFPSPFGSKPTSNSGFSFGNAQNQSVPSFGSSATQSTSFGAPTTTAPPSLGFGANKSSSVFNINGVKDNNAQTRSLFNAAGNVFGSSTSNNSQPQPLPGVSNTSASNTTFMPPSNQLPTAAAAPFSFGNSSALPEATKSTQIFSFGANNAASSTSAPKPQAAGQPFLFGASSSGTASTAATRNMFGVPSTTATVKPASAGPTTTNIFSNSNTAAVKPSFNFTAGNAGAGNSASIMPNPSQSLFGVSTTTANMNSAASATFVGNQNKPFTFGASGFQGQGTFLNSTTTNGGINATTSGQMNNSFSFGSGMNKPPATSAAANSTPFALGANNGSNNINNTLNSSNNAQAAPATKPVAFTFTAGNAAAMPASPNSTGQISSLQSQQLQLQQQTANNLFGPPAGEQRVVRRAVRRLQKS